MPVDYDQMQRDKAQREMAMALAQIAKELKEIKEAIRSVASRLK